MIGIESVNVTNDICAGMVCSYMSRVSFILSIFILISVPAVTAVPLMITQPSANETTLAEVRNFYVHGIYDSEILSPGDIRSPSPQTHP